MEMRLRFGPVMVALTVTACESGDPGASAGEAGAAPVLVPVDSPSLVIGRGARPETQLHRVTGAFRLSIGAIVVLNAGTSEVRYFDARGAHVRSIGGRGSGPGEFGSMDAAVFHGQRAWTLDDGVTLIEPSFVTSVTTRGPDGLRQDTLPLLRLDPETGAIGSVGFFAGHTAAGCSSPRAAVSCTSVAARDRSASTTAMAPCCARSTFRSSRSRSPRTRSPPPGHGFST